MATNITISPPWVRDYRKINALFAKDPAVNVIFDETQPKITLYVDGQAKYEALSKLLPEKFEYGNVEMIVNIVPANTDSLIQAFRDAFYGNEAVANIYEAIGVGGAFNYIAFVPEVVQYFADNMGDINGNESCLYQDIARQVFAEHSGDGVFFCTEAATPELSKHLGEWP